MKHVIIGTAGHIDHGKTTLIRALTGKDTDTLKEEKDRGISINLGFTYFDLPSGRRAGIIDVPGHERFIKNMLAGISGIDIVLLVIAADEGIMPQTREHFEILQILNVKKGIIVLTKSDIVDEEWLEMIKEDVKKEFEGTFLENSNIHAVSSKTGRGLDELIKDIDATTEEIAAKDIDGHFRLPVDRVFSISGFGTIVTGTVISGNIKEGENVQIYPQMTIAKVRNIQVHDKDVEVAEAGQRCALNLSGVKVEEVKRGDVVSAQNIMEPSLMLDCRLHYLKSAEKPLENRQRVRLYHGSSEILCRVIILDKEEIKPGEDAYVQLRLERPLTSQRNDRYVIRSYSPMHTIGGGSIIDPNALKAKSFNTEYINNLKVKESGKTEDIIESTVKKLSSDYPDEFDILKALGKNEIAVEDKLEKLVHEEKIKKLIDSDKPVYIHEDFIKEKAKEMQQILTKFHKENPLKEGISKEEIKNKVFGKNIKQKNYDELLGTFSERNIISLKEKSISLYGFEVIYTKDQEKIRNTIMKAFIEAKYTPPKMEELILNEKDKKTFKMVFESLLDIGSLIKVSEECVFTHECYIEAKEKVVSYIEKNSSISAAEARDIFSTSRKYAVALLENFDNIKLTKRIEDKRVLAK